MDGKIYFVGAHSSGKTTLAELCSSMWGLPLVPEVARVILKEWDTTLQAVRMDIRQADRFQLEIWKRQREEEAKHPAFVSDRACDHLAYALSTSRVGPTIFLSDDFKRYMFDLQLAQVFLIKPQAALLKPDGLRLDLDWESVLKLDANIEMLLRLFDVPYTVIDTVNMAERVRIVETQLRHAGIL